MSNTPARPQQGSNQPDAPSQQEATLPPTPQQGHTPPQQGQTPLYTDIPQVAFRLT